VDGIGDMRGVLRQRFGDKLVTPLISAERGWFGRRTPGVAGGALLQGLSGGQISVGIAEDLISALEARAVWARFGL
jgi:serine protease SohB